jgi:hypothetical protein
VKSAVKVEANGVYTAEFKTKNHLRRRKKVRLALRTAGRVSVSVQQYSVQCKGYNLIGVTTVEASETRGTTALVYCLISSSLYTGTVQGWWSTPPIGLTVSRGEVHPNWFDGQQGFSQLSTLSVYIL